MDSKGLPWSSNSRTTAILNASLYLITGLTQSLSWACALSDWEAVRRIADYPPETRFPEAARAGGETAWAWALIMFLRNEARERVEHFLDKAEGDKAKRPKLLGPVLRALLDSNRAWFEKALIAYARGHGLLHHRFQPGNLWPWS